MRLAILVSILYGILLSGCASVDLRIYEPGGLKAVDSWSLDFAYESGSVEQVQKSSGDSEIRVLNSGKLPQDLQLRDDLYYSLRDDFEVPVVTADGQSAGQILIHPVHFRFGGFKLLTVTFTDRSGRVLARLKIENGDRNGTMKGDDAFAAYASQAIADAVQGRLSNSGE